MANYITGREVVVGCKKATTWRTAVLCGASDGLLITEGFGGAKAPTFVPDDSLGNADILDYYKTSESISDSFGGYLRYQGWDVPLALVMGSDTVALVNGTGYSHTMAPAASIADYFATLCVKKANTTEGMWEYPSAKISGFTISAKVGELAKISFDFMANKIETDELSAINSPVTAASITYPTTLNVVRPNQNFKIRMNSQSGSALADSDKIYPYGFTLTYKRPMQENFQAANFDANEPIQNGFSEATLQLNFDKYSLDTFTAAIEDETDYKMDITFTGDTISGSTSPYTLRIDIPKITFLTADAPLSGAGVIQHNVTGNLQAVSSAPTGMSGVTTPISIYMINARSTSGLA